MFMSSTLIREEMYERSLNVSEQVLNLTDGRYYGAWNNKAAALMSLGRYDEAAIAYENAEKLYKTCTIAKNIGYIKTVQGKYREAIEAYDRCLENCPTYSEAWQFKGSSLAALGRYEEALNSFDQATIQDPKMIDAWKGKAEILTRLGRYQDARFAYGKAAESS